MSKHLTLTFSGDPDHAWLEVESTQIADFAICHCIRAASYVGDDIALLKNDHAIDVLIEGCRKLRSTPAVTLGSHSSVVIA